MNRPTTPKILRQAIATGSLSLLLLPWCLMGIAPKDATANSIADLGTIDYKPPPPPERDAPGNRGGGGGRGCGPNSQPTTALIPTQKRMLNGNPETETVQVWGTTLSERPTFWFDVPDEKSTIKSMEFVLQDSTDQDLYRSWIVPPETPGIVRVGLPETATALKPGTLYHWFLNISFECPSDASVTRQINGWIQRVAPDAKLTEMLKNATPEQQAILYAKHGIWFDALTILGDLRRSKPKELSAIENWNRLLQSIGLENLKTEPIVNCCKPKSIEDSIPAQK
jgi:Domain of Unknown Function (DUF928)